MTAASGVAPTAPGAAVDREVHTGLEQRRGDHRHDGDHRLRASCCRSRSGAQSPFIDDQLRRRAARHQRGKPKRSPWGDLPRPATTRQRQSFQVDVIDVSPPAPVILLAISLGTCRGATAAAVGRSQCGASLIEQPPHGRHWQSALRRRPYLVRRLAENLSLAGAFESEPGSRPAVRKRSRELALHRSLQMPNGRQMTAGCRRHPASIRSDGSICGRCSAHLHLATIIRRTADPHSLAGHRPGTTHQSYDRTRRFDDSASSGLCSSAARQTQVRWLKTGCSSPMI